MSNITRDRCRQVLTDGIDKLLNHRWLTWLSGEQNAVLSGCRAVVVCDDAVVDKIVAGVGPYQHPERHGGPAAAVEGPVRSVQLAPGLLDGLLIVGLDADRLLWLLAGEEGADCRCDGQAVTTPSALLAWLAGHECGVKAWPLAERYGAVLRAEFTSTKEKS